MKRSGIRGFIGNKGTISWIPLRCIQATNYAVMRYFKWWQWPHALFALHQ